MKKFLMYLALFPFIYVPLVFLTEPLATEIYRYRIEVVIDDNGVERSASGVVQREFQKLFLPFPFPGRSSASFRAGEAIPIDLGEKGVVFYLRRGTSWAFDTLFQNGQNFGFSAIGFRKVFWPNTGEFEKVTFFYMRRVQEFAILKDRNDPSSIEKFGVDEFEEFVGKGVKLKSLTLELVSPGLQFSNVIDWLKTGARSDYRQAVPVTMGIQKQFPWIDCGKVIASVRIIYPDPGSEGNRVNLNCGSFIENTTY